MSSCPSALARTARRFGGSASWRRHIPLKIRDSLGRAMIQSNEDLEGYLVRLERRFERAEDGTYLLSMGADRPLVALRVAVPVLVAQVDIGQAPADDASGAVLFRKLLVLNATA